MLVKIILSLLLSLAPNHEDLNEVKEARLDRFTDLSTAQVEVAESFTCTGEYNVDKCLPIFAGSREQLLALLMTAGWWETRYSARIHAGECKKSECDSGKARSVYQVHDNGTYPSELWENAEGLDYESTLSATKAAGYSFSAAWRVCKPKHGTRGVWAAYGRGYCTASYKTLGGRIKWYFRLTRTLKE